MFAVRHGTSPRELPRVGAPVAPTTDEYATEIFPAIFGSAYADPRIHRRSQKSFASAVDLATYSKWN